LEIVSTWIALYTEKIYEMLIWTLRHKKNPFPTKLLTESTAIDVVADVFAAKFADSNEC